MATRYPSQDGRYTHLGDFRDDTQRNSNLTRYRGLPHSQSESSVDFWRKVHKRGVSSSGTENSGSDRIRLSEDTTSGSSSSASASASRGRSLLRTPSPTKELDTIKEDPSSSEASPALPVKRSRSPVKQLFGENGWLGKSPSKDAPPEEQKEPALKRWGEKLRRRVDHMVCKSQCSWKDIVSLIVEQTEDLPKIDMSKLMQSPSKSKSPPKTTRFYVTLTPPQQAKLYSEVELMICATANSFLTLQQDEGRMSIEALSDLLQSWAMKGRPQVIEFMFDQQTQRELIVNNIKSFRFFGPNAENLISVNSMAHAWKTLAREMNIRTFCSPDAVVKKHLHDSYRVLETLGAPSVTMMAFLEMKFKIEQLIELGQRRIDIIESVGLGVERPWEPSARERELERYNSFA